ncbi:MAG: hypothetical protein LH468_00115 [Nocardioides sp.]|nr:hypothetical protein [Nocardioides sp.]
MHQTRIETSRLVAASPADIVAVLCDQFVVRRRRRPAGRLLLLRLDARP